MTCKVSFFNSICETIKHHIASTFASVLVFFIQFLVFFLNVQNISASQAFTDDIGAVYIRNDIIYLTQPHYGYYFAIALVAVILAFDYFRYLHSKKQMDFYEALPITRKETFLQKTVVSFTVFLVPYILCIVLEALILYGYSFRDPLFYMNLLYNALCMILAFAITWITGVLAMVMTGHPVIAFFGFGIFCGYAPIILRFIFPLYADAYFDTYINNNSFLYDLTYLSPIGASLNLIGRNRNSWLLSEHTKDFLILILLLVFVFGLTFYLFTKRPSEAAGRAMAFEKFNSVIRIALVIPLALYLGIYLGNVTDVATEIWMIIGYILGVILLHGIIQSIFEFDIRALWSHKLQMVLCFVATLGIAFSFWTDAFGYDKYLPQQDKLEAIKLNINDPYHHRYNNIDGLHDSQMALAYELLQSVIDENYSYNKDMPYEDETSMRVTYYLNNNKEINRRYYFSTSKYSELIDKIYVTEDYKNDICELYSLDFSKVVNVEWNDAVTSYPLILTEAQQDTLFETFLTEFTPFSYTEMKETSALGSFQVSFDSENGYQDAFNCYVFPQFEQTIALLEEYLANTTIAKDYGSLTTPILDRYKINSLDIYNYEGDPFYARDPELIATLKESLIFADDFYMKHQGYNSDLYYDGNAEVTTYSGRSYISILIPKEALAPYLQ